MVGTNSLRKIALLFLLALFVLPLSAEAAAPNVATVRSTTIYLQTSTLGHENTILYDYLVEHIPELKANGFNTFWFVTPWFKFDPRPLATPHVYNDAAFASAKNILELLRQNDMRAIIGLNYFGAGWGPDFNNDGVSNAADKYCELTTDPQKFAAFETYVKKFLTEMQPYSDMIYPLVFTEASTPCGLTVTSNGEEVAAAMRATLGSLPTRLPPSLRAKYNFGYHDNAILNDGTGHGASPAVDGAFDFFSMVAYDFDDLTDTEIAAEIDLRANRYRQAHPGTPLIFGELGAQSCVKATSPHQYTEADQTRVLSAAVRHALSRGIGVNLWTYPWIPADSSADCPDGQLVLQRQDGTPKAVIPAIKAIFSSIGSCYWNGQSVATGASVVAYQRPQAPFGSQCVSQTRTCLSGALTGGYLYPSCTVDAPLPPPLLTSSTEGTSPFPVVFTYNLNRNYFCDAGSYRFSFGDEDWAAGDVFKNLTWAAGICAPVTGTISHTYTTPGAYKAALNNGSTGEALGSSVVYVAPGAPTPPTFTPSATQGTAPFTVAFSYTLNVDSSCLAGKYYLSFGDEDWAAGDIQQRPTWAADVCAPSTQTISHTYTKPGIYVAQLNNPGVALLGSAKITVASATAHPSCSWDGQSVAHGQSVTGYQSASVAYGSQCASQTRTCTDGALSGSYPYADCATEPPASPFTANITEGTASFPVTFTYTLNKDSSCSAGLYYLFFGDEDWAAGDTSQKPSWTSGICAPIVQTITHTYTTPGIYLAQLNNPGIAQLGSAKITVATAPPPPDVTLPGTTAEDIVVADANEGTAPFTVTFSYLLNRTASCTEGGYNIYFGDEDWAAGDTATRATWAAGTCAKSIQTLTHTYTQKGIYKMQIFDISSGAGVLAGVEFVTVGAPMIVSLQDINNNLSGLANALTAFLSFLSWPGR